MSEDTIPPLPKTLSASLAVMLFRSQVEELRTAYEVSVNALRERAERAEQTVREAWGLQPGEEAPPYDDDTGYAPDFSEQVGELAAEMEAAIRHVRIAFTISLYHQFERQAKRWTKTKAYRKQTLAPVLEKRAIAFDISNVEALEVAANLAKHGDQHLVKKLQKIRPDLINNGELEISAEAMTAFFAIFAGMRARI